MKIIALLVLLFTFSGCAASPEMPTNQGDDSDTMKPSPCVCNEVDFDSRGFTWVS